MSAGASVRRVYYNSHAEKAVYAIIREAMPPGFELVSLATDDDAERREKIADAEVAIVAGYRLGQDLIEAAERLELVHHQGVGYQDTLDTRALAKRGVRLALTTAGTTESVAEHAVLLALAVLRRLPFADAELRRGRWHVNALRPESRDLRGRTVGYVGMGRIGQAVAARMRAFGTRGVYHDPLSPLDAARAAELGLTAAPLDEVVRRADVLTLHVPGTPENTHLIDATRIASMKPDAVLVNTARGTVVDQRALAAALVEGRLGGAALDVFENEPPAVDDPLMGLRNVVVTPHISAGTRDSLATKMQALFDNVVCYYADGTLENEVDLSDVSA